MPEKPQMNGLSEKLSVYQRFMYGMGNMGGNFMNLIFSMWIFKRYCPPEGQGEQLVPLMWLTAAFAVGRVVDAVSDPLIGYWSDNVSTRWGRRIPFMLFGGLPLCLSFFLMWAPPLAMFPPNSVLLFGYLCVVMGAFWFLFTAVLCPYLALMPEVAADEDDRVNLSTYMTVFMLVSSGIVMGVGPVLKDKIGFAYMGLVFTILGFIGVYAPVIAIKERFREKTVRNYGIWTALKWSFSNRPFVIYLTSSMFCQLGFNAILMSMSYFVTVILMKPDSYTAIIMGGTGVFAVVTFLFINKFIDRLDKSKVYLYGMLGMSIALPFIYLFGQYDMSINLSFIGIDYVVSELMTAFILFTVTGAPVATIMLLPAPILSDIIDLDELNTGERREAMYFGAQGLLQKSGAGMSGVIMGLLFSRFGKDPGNHLGIDLLGPVTAVFVFIGFVIFLWYPITSEKSGEIRAQLRERHAAKAAE